MEGADGSAWILEVLPRAVGSSSDYANELLGLDAESKEMVAVSVVWLSDVVAWIALVQLRFKVLATKAGKNCHHPHLAR